MLTPVEHLAELRKRLFIIIILLLAGTIVGYYNIDKIIAILLEPVREIDFIYLTPPELFLAYLKISIIVSAIVTSPLIFLQVWLFVRPGLVKKEKIYLVFSLLAGFFLFLLGGFFAYKVIIPITIDFFIKLKIPEIEPRFSFGSYISFINSILLSFGLVFELPILVVLLTKLRLITPETLKKYRKVIILFIFILAAFLSPPDVISQALLAAPMLVLFEISVIISKVIYKRNKD